MNNSNFNSKILSVVKLEKNNFNDVQENGGFEIRRFGKKKNYLLPLNRLLSQLNHEIYN